MRRLIVVLLVFAGFGWSQEPSSKNPAELPVKRVVLYKNGVGYFEHVGHITGNQDLKIQFTTGQLNDVLKSLTVVDLGGGSISSVRYNSIAPLSERLGMLRLRLGEQTSRADFLNSIRGARVEVRDGSLSAVGKLLSVESGRRILRDQVADTQQVVIVTDSGELRTFDLTPTTTIRLADTELTQEVGRYLDLIGSSRAKDLRSMSIATAGKGDREVVVSYISEVPVWKSTYRIVMPRDPAGKPLLQGWAIVDNTIGEDWKNVELSLVAGSPQSFVQQISQPMYVRRPTVELPQFAMLTPQTHEATMDEPAPPPPPAPASSSGTGVGAGYAGGIAGGIYSVDGGSANATVNGRILDPTGAVVPNARVIVTNKQTGQVFQAATDSNGNYNLAIAPGDSVIKVETPGFSAMQTSRQVAPLSSFNFSPTMRMASTDQTVEVSAEVAAVDTTSSSIIGRTAGISVDAEGRPLGDLFEYALKQKITVLQNQSALVPIVQSPITAEQVTVWNSEDQAPLRALWVRNTSGVTLDAGSFNIIEGDAFAGEGMIAELHPDERRLISYAADTAVRVESDDNDDDNDTPYTHVTIAKGLMKLTREQRNSVSYKIRNTDTEPRNVIVEHPAQEGWQLEDGLKPEESTSSFHRFRVKVEPNKTAELKVSEFKPEETQYAISNLTSDQVALFVSEKALDPSIERSLRDVLAKKNEIGRVDNEILGRKQEMNRINQEQSRLRDNMKVLKGSAEEKALLQRYVHQMNVQEDRLATLNGEIDKFELQRQRLAGELDHMVQNIAVDEKLESPAATQASK